MKIENHQLCDNSGTPVEQRESPNQGATFRDLRYLVMHYTAGASAESSIQHLTNPSAKASAHLVIGRDGAITQLVPFNKIAWHAGRSRWQGLVGMNKYSIGVELDNVGPLEGGAGNWRSWFGRTIPDEEVLVAAPRLGGPERGWQRYTEAQLTAAMEAAEAICTEYGLSDVLGHDDIAPNRKLDPGPAFPMSNFQSHLVGRAEDDFELFQTTTRLNIRTGPGTGFEKLVVSPLAKGSRLVSERQENGWHQVEVLEAGGTEVIADGWVHGNYITPVG